MLKIIKAFNFRSLIKLNYLGKKKYCKKIAFFMGKRLENQTY